jgi:hypothetical protein
MSIPRSTKTGGVVLAGVMASLVACGPSGIYREGRGFYSEQFSPGLVRSAAQAGKVTSLGRFSFETSACGNYSAGLADRNLVKMTLQEQLPHLGANAAQKVRATEGVGSFLFSLLLLPMGCSDWTISGEALLVDASAFDEQPARR